MLVFLKKLCYTAMCVSFPAYPFTTIKDGMIRQAYFLKAGRAMKEGFNVKERALLQGLSGASWLDNGECVSLLTV